jgi:hypothetical protein
VDVSEAAEWSFVELLSNCCKPVVEFLPSVIRLLSCCGLAFYFLYSRRIIVEFVYSYCRVSFELLYSHVRVGVELLFSCRIFFELLPS